MRFHLIPARVSIAWKLTGFFFLFGVILSTAAFLVYGRAATTISLRVGSDMAESAFELVFGTHDAATLALLEDDDDGRLLAFERAMPFLATKTGINGMELFGKAPDGRWLIFTHDAAGAVEPEPAVDTVIQRLDHALTHHIAFGANGRFGSSVVHAYMGLPTAADGTQWVLGADVDGTSLLELFSSYGTETAMFALILAGLSLILGRVFARRFSQPITGLAAAADDYRRGNRAAAFHNTRRDEIGVLGRTLAAMAEEIDRRRRETESRLAIMEAMNRIDKAVLVTTSRGELLARVASIIDTSMHSTAVAIALRDESGQGWNIAALTDSVDHAGIDWNSHIEQAPFVSDALLEPGFDKRLVSYYESPLADAGPGVAVLALDVMGSGSGRLVAAPLKVDGHYLGSLISVVDRNTPLPDDERRTFAMLADQAAVALRSIMEHETSEDNFFGVIRSLTRAVEAKSRWTAGHSERVSDMAVQLGTRLKLSTEDLRLLRISATLHDVGKIGIGEAILDKPGSLTADEYAQIKQHPAIGATMLQDIRSFERVVPSVLHHHERWDGNGYPGRLAGEAIPLGARIIAIADVWDAIRDDRPYRAGFPLAEAQAFMQDQTGVMFDPALVETFLQLVET
ncbi:MAG TPA: HD domain-containing phosphohydrolase [bacterium]|nr:HD domain-containing phosphohydrolase [bacterium]